MNFGRFFVDRPRFAVVLSILVVLVGALAYLGLPVTQYPDIAPPTIVVSATYPGATPEVIADTVATPLEQAINGVEGMLYMTSSSTSDGFMQLSVTFALGTDLDTAQVLVQNRVASASPRLPEEVRRLGLVTEKSSPSLMMVVHLLSPDGTYDDLYISNYVLLRISDVLQRIGGVGNLTVFGAREYSMRVWLDPDRLAELGLTGDDVVNALRGQNVQVAAGTLGQPPTPTGNAFQLTVNTQGRFVEADQFADVVIKTGQDGRLTRVRDVARVELGAVDYVRNSYLNGRQAVGIGIFQRPGSNALATAQAIRDTMDELARDFPDGLDYEIAYDPTQFVQESVNAVYHTLFEAVLLVVLVITLFLQSWRAALIPIVAIPVSLIGTFAVMSAVGFSLNTLSLFGLVLAIGIVVDDAIVVVENIERNLEEGMDPAEASRVTMDEVGTALIAMALVLVAVFVPAAFLGGISGEFFRQFALTIAASTVISAFNSLTLSPALGAVLLVPKDREVKRGRLGELVDATVGRLLKTFFRAFDRVFDALRDRYATVVDKAVRFPIVPVILFLLLLVAGGLLLKIVPPGFIPAQDQGYLIVAVELPKGASLERTDAVVLEADRMIRDLDGVADVVAIAGFSGATFAAAPNAGAMFVLLEPFEQRPPGVTSAGLLPQIQSGLQSIREASFFVIAPPPVQGLGTGGGFKMLVQDRSGQGLKALESQTWALVGQANRHPDVAFAFSTFSTSNPRYFLDIDRTRAQMLDVPPENIFETLRINLGSAYVNDFNLFGRTYRVTAQADAPFRMEPDDILRLRTRSRSGAMVPLGSLVDVRRTNGPDRIVRHNLFPAAELQGEAPAGSSTGEAIGVVEELAASHLERGFGYEWTEIAYQEKRAGNAGAWLLPLSVIFVFLLLAAQYESWSLPAAIVLIVPLCVLFALSGVWLRGMSNNILTQIGFVVLIGLASKNAILIVEFAKQQEDAGKNRFDAAVEACRLRLRPILMTSLAFILGVVPLVIATGAGFEMRRVLGTAVFSGMLGVTAVGLFLTPVFYVLIRGFVTRSEQTTEDERPSDPQEPDEAPPTPKPEPQEAPA